MKIAIINKTAMKVKLINKHKGAYKLNIQFHNHNSTLQNPIQNQSKLNKPNKKEAKSKQHPGFAASLLRYY